ncbi:hypothetical protein AVEN_64329-1 [Araneus ventricosus]|uniref:Uncharacterized protein n=1 Tax=Araneus ventricosus TaxID=182803 RepID=A0A4Y2D8U8_ARAVE|nr:hypothetical protein AVEN_64329-1 [Araneus ventricosus]
MMEILGGSFTNLACNQLTAHVTKLCSSQDMDLSLRCCKDSTLPKPHSVLVGGSEHQSIMLRFPFSQPPTIWHHPDNNISQYGSTAWPTIHRQEGRYISFSKEKPVFSIPIPINPPAVRLSDCYV